jgi:NAD(P)-dependent dehydrogenase (short-subunit alcohol dehydrogenase family)
MSERANGPVALISGAAQGIGLGIARSLAQAGSRVALSDVRGERAVGSASALCQEGFEAVGLSLDVTRADDWKRAVGQVVERWGRLDVLVNNAGISPRGTAESTDEALWDRTIAINLKGAWLGIKAALPWLKASRGTIVNVGSTRGTRPMPGLFSYGASKAGLLGLTQQVAVEYLPDGVTCNMVAPGWVDTPGERVLQAAHGRPDFPSGIQNLLTPEDVGAAVVFLVSPAGRKANGLNLLLDSGLHVADDAGMVYLPGRSRPPYAQTLNETGTTGGNEP